MSGERVEDKRRRAIPRWMARIVGSTCISTALFIPASSQELSMGTMDYNPGITLEDATVRPLPYNQPPPPPEYDQNLKMTRDTGMDSIACKRFLVCGTDLGIPFRLADGSEGYLFGDTFAVTGPFLEGVPAGEDKYRSSVMLHASETPVDGHPVPFDAAIGDRGTNEAAELLGGWHMLVNDGITLPDGRVVVSYQHTVEVDEPEDHTWHTDYSGLAWSADGANFEHIGPRWENGPDNDDPYQMWSMQLDGDYVNIVSVKAGRKPGPMMLFRVPWNQMQDKSAYTYWNGADWGAQEDAKPIFEGRFGEPSLRKLDDGTWAMAYGSAGGIVTRTLKNNETGPSGEWNKPKIQLTWQELPFLYGGFIHPDSTPDNLILMVSSWQRDYNNDMEHGKLIRYDVSHIIRSL